MKTNANFFECKSPAAFIQAASIKNKDVLPEAKHHPTTKVKSGALFAIIGVLTISNRGVISQAVVRDKHIVNMAEPLISSFSLQKLKRPIQSEGLGHFFL